jgi:dienelactone hydrolase
MRRMLVAMVVSLVAGAAPASAEPLFGFDPTCWGPVADAEPGTPEWTRRDNENQRCATVRLRDQMTHPAYGFSVATEGADLYADRWLDQIGDPEHPRGGVTTLVPGSQAADAYRTVKRWVAAGRGRVAEVEFPSLNGSTLRGHVWAPPASAKRPKRGFPGVVVTDGSVQGYEEMYHWAAQDLASAGYVVLTYDVQGQGDSDLAGDDCPGACTGVPYQQPYNFLQGAEDSLSFFVSAENPFGELLDERKVGIAGHSLGGLAVSHVGQCDARVKAIVAWDGLKAVESCDGIEIAPEHRSDATLIDRPALDITNDYFFNPQPTFQRPAADAKQAGYAQVAAAGLDAASIVIRGGTHLEYTYIPYVLPATQIGERIASYYTVAFFDRHLKNDKTAFDRLVAPRFDGSIDRHAIGTGVFDAARVDPLDPFSGNVPHRIEGLAVRDAVSFYYRSSYALTDPETGSRVECADIRAGC